MRASFRLVAALSLLAAAAACSIDNPSNRFADITYAHRPDIGLDVGVVEVEQAYQDSGQPPHVENRFPRKPGAVAQQWARDRLVARGDRLTFRYIVREASAVETPLEQTGGVKGLITTDQSERYEVHIVVEMQILDGRQLQGTATAEARRSVTVAEDISLNERERVWYKLTEDTMNDLDKQLEETIRSAFFPYIVL